jgi:thiol-disulfide isomerase/thioredoxin
MPFHNHNPITGGTMNRSHHRLAGVVLVLVLLPLWLAGCGGGGNKSSSSAYDFTLPDLDGRQVSFSDYQGKVIMVNFWAPWCGPCRMETPDLIALFEQYQEQGFQILGVAVAFRGEQSVRDFAGESSITYPVLFGNDGLVRQYGGFRGIPCTFLFSRDGKLYRKYEGMRPRNVFEQDIKALL